MNLTERYKSSQAKLKIIKNSIQKQIGEYLVSSQGSYLDSQAQMLGYSRLPNEADMSFRQRMTDHIRGFQQPNVVRVTSLQMHDSHERTTRIYRFTVNYNSEERSISCEIDLRRSYHSEHELFQEIHAMLENRVYELYGPYVEIAMINSFNS